jgi:hypothetical protein
MAEKYIGHFFCKQGTQSSGMYISAKNTINPSKSRPGVENI